MDKWHSCLSDNVKNTMKAMSDAVVAHTLQLAVNEGLLAQRRLADATADGGKIAGHFKHSTLVYSSR